MTLAPDDPRHGTTNGYGHLGCRCTDCRAAARVYWADYRRRCLDQYPIVRLPVAPLLDAIPTPPPVRDQAARRAWQRARANGHITDRAADKLATYAGRHVLDIWPDYYQLIDQAMAV